MSFDPTEHAVRVVARRIVAQLIASHPPQWEDYPDIGEDDWRLVDAAVWKLGERQDVGTDTYAAAYRHLAGRAERGEA